MKRLILLGLVALSLLAIVLVLQSPTTVQSAPQPAPAFQAGGVCESLIRLELPQTTITLAETREAGKSFVPQYTTAPITPTQAFCRVAGIVEPEVRFEVWLPTPAKWNGKFNGVGNGGLAGSIGYAAMNTALGLDYATASTDTGHVGGNGSWAMGRPELLVDFASRGIHVMTIDAKLIIQAYYSSLPKYSYFTGCSGGGGQALSELQRYPLDYNGIVAGAPASNVTHMWPGEQWAQWVNLKDPAGTIPAAKLPAIKNAALAACDANDNVKDGIIQDPRTCKFDPATIQCSGADSATCLTPAQVTTVKTIYAGMKDPTTGKQFWPPYMIGTELNWAQRLGTPGGPPLAYFKYFYFNDMNWDWKTLDFNDPKSFQLLYDADAKLRGVLNSTDPDIGSFKSAGGKFILYHGWQDQNISPINSINYYDSIVAMQGGMTNTLTFARLFMMPGVGHCGGGEGATAAVPDLLVAISNWVEKGQAPESISASHNGPDGKPDLTRPLCVFPNVEVYKGSGDVKDAANFTCGPAK
jgi:feruloyl esterase